MEKKKETDSRKYTENILATGVDAGLVALFLKMTPEERVQSNDNAINTIMELRNAFEQRQFRNKPQ